MMTFCPKHAKSKRRTGKRNSKSNGYMKICWHLLRSSSYNDRIHEAQYMITFCQEHEKNKTFPEQDILQSTYFNPFQPVLSSKSLLSHKNIKINTKKIIIIIIKKKQYIIHNKIYQNMLPLSAINLFRPHPSKPNPLLSLNLASK